MLPRHCLIPFFIIVRTATILCLNYRPQFSRYQLISSIYENSPHGTSVTKLSDYASDDEGDFITYSLDTVGQSYCTIDPVNGLITTSQVLDREMKDMISFTAFAEDNYQGGGANRRASIMVFIYVLDINEWPPEFQGTPYTVSIRENASMDQSVLTLRATDKDDGPNAEISFQFKNGTKIPQFALDINSGLIKVAGRLDYEAAPRYTLSVVAKDKGDPSLSSETMVIVDVQDVSDSPPVFSPSPIYDVKVDENLPINSKVIKITATDGDKGVNSAIAYQIESGNDEGFFSIDESSGDIMLNATLDYETKSVYHLKIKAYEVPTPASSASANVTIRLNDVNDFAPKFKNHFYSFTIDEDKPSGFIITQQLTASDGDATSTNNAFRYSLSGDSSKFSINSLNGQLTVNAVLDYDTQSKFIFTVLATETLSKERLSGNATIAIDLLNVNDNKPIFSQSNYVFETSENTGAGTVIGTVKAVDADKGGFGEVSYSLSFSSQTGPQIFVVNSTTGQISLKSKPDYEMAKLFEFQVIATDGGGSSSKSSSTNVKVEITDTNDNDPSFTNLPTKIYVPENKAPGRIFTVQATDRDSGPNGEISFKLMNSSAKRFSFDEKTGELNTTGPFDYESSIKWFYLIFTVFDHGSKQRNATQILEVAVQDENDFSPVFDKSSYNASIMENSKIGSIVVDLNATDLDSGLNSKITYLIISGNDQNAFAISVSNGEIRTQDILDRERKDSYLLTIQASDHGVQSLSTTTKVFIRVEDDNDNFPNFLEPSYSVKVNESIAEGSKILQLRTRDNDIGENARVTYSIISGNEKGKFKLSNSSGELIVAKQLDWEATTAYILSIKAEDHGIVRKSRNTFVTIEIADDNDHSPVFTQSKYTFQIFENSPVDGSLGRVTAVDEDGKIPPNTNGIVRYSIVNGNQDGAFRIDALVGIIYVNATLDRESIPFHNLTVAATDGGYPPNSATVYVGIDVLDINDNSPIFTNQTYFVAVHENVSVGFVIAQIKASDRDSGLNARLAYTITRGNINNVFTIKHDGNLTVDENLDRETTQQYQLNVKAVDSGSPQRASDVDVIVQVLDVNDNAPVFQGTPYNAHVLEGQKVGVHVLQVLATDVDDGVNAGIKYRIESSMPSDAFHLNETSGNITTKSVLDREAHSVYKINVSASDNGRERLTSFAIVTVAVLDVNDNVPFVGNLPNGTSVREDAVKGSIVFQIDAGDKDAGENAKLFYTIISGGEGQFSVTSDGEVVTSSLLDRETQHEFSLRLNVTDGGTPPLMTSSTLQIKVTDINDNAPRFVPDPLRNPAWYSKAVPEGIASLGETVFVANATDADEGINAAVLYSIESGNEKGHFAMDNKTGEIKVVKVIDREDAGMDLNSIGFGIFTLVIKAEDQATVGSKSVTTNVILLISDVNDNRPVFKHPSNFAGVTEGVDVLSTVITLTASDKDILTNARIQYSIVDGDPNGDFTIVNKYVGSISVAKSINAEKRAWYNLTIMAKDEGDLSGGVALNSTTIVQIQVGDVNDNAPVFNQSAYKASIRENSPFHTYVIRIHATDPDRGTNGEVWYQIASGDTNNMFEIDNKTGVVYTVLPIDREQYERFTLTIKAEDKGKPKSRKSSVELIVDIEDVNDNPMRFKLTDYFGHISENSPPGTLVTLSSPIEFADPDSKTTLSTLHISGKDSEKFSVNSTSRTIRSSANSSFDRELIAICYLKITVTDTDGLFSTADLVVVVNDVNDNPPTFNVSRSVVKMNENSSVGYLLLRISAYDNDDGSNSVISYTMQGGDEKFVYNQTLGMIQLIQKIDRETQDHYKLILIAADQGNPALQGRTAIDVLITDSIDSVPYFDPAVITIDVNESTPVHSIIFKVTAKDLDLNDVIRYKLTSGHVHEMMFNASTGELELIRALNRENVSNYEMTFQAIDANSLSSPGNGLTLRVQVLDANDNNPAFLQPFYLNDVVENTPDGTIVMSVLAVDADEGENGRVTYSIKENLANLLRIDAEKGLISKYGLWKTTPGEFLNFTVIATDGGSPPQHGSVNCSIRWVAVNALNPRFNKSLYSIVLSEDTKPGTDVIQLTAYKRGKAEPVKFSITGGQGNFVIDRNTGVIRVLNSLDREVLDRFAITVTATDSQAPPQKGVTSVTIAIQDVNDNRPKFLLGSYKFSISEDADISTLVGNVVAVDRDSGNNSKLIYSIQSGNERNWFSIDSADGSIRTKSFIDREIQDKISLHVIVRDHGLNPLNSSVLVTITILDVNDNKPTFGEQVYNISVAENLPGDSQILMMRATDSDNGRNGTIFYSIVSGNDQGNFYIGRTTGVVRLAKILDFETTTNFSLGILAIDDGEPFNRSSITTVLINVIDINDNKPRFLLPSYSFSIDENNPIGHHIGQVQAVDDDVNYNAVFYDISNMMYSSFFQISSTNGSITAKRSLDREKASSYIFTVEAFNKDQYGNASLMSFVEVTIRVLDLNDNSPTFQPPSCCNVSVGENAEVNTVIVRIAASDADTGFNKDISYNIASGNHNSDFEIVPSNGDLTTKKLLDHERIGYYELTVIAKDHGKPMMSSSAIIRIHVLDINDNAPIFAPFNSSVVSEDTSVGTLVARVTAVDADTGRNGRISYEILAGNGDGAFTLSPHTGSVEVAKSLDYERQQNYALRIIARDQGVPSISSITTLHVNITNINDNFPIFSQGTLSASIKENSPVGFIIATILASDADKDPIFYYIKDGNKKSFSIDEVTGVLRNLEVMDREKTQSISLNVEATNFQRKKSESRSKRDAESAIGNPISNEASTQRVTIKIMDENDNPPKFTQREYRAGLSANAKYGTNVVQVVAIDFDEDNNSNISYTAFAQSNDRNMFEIDRKSGWIRSAQSFVGKVGQNYELKILAQDNDGKQPNLNDTALVNIFVLTDNQRVVLRMKVDPKIVRENIKEIVQGLQNITGFKINIDEIQYSQKDGEYDTKSTDLVFHAVNPADNKIQDKDVVIKAMERNEPNYQEFFTKWKVQSVKAVVMPTSAPLQDETQTILIAVAAALFLVILGFVFAIYHIRRKQRRKLKAATASAHNSDATAELQHMQTLNSYVKGAVGGTLNDNQQQRSIGKASERFYPMWIEPKDDNFDSASSSASYYEENKSINNLSNTRTMTTEIIMMSDPFVGETEVDYYADVCESEDMSDMFDSQTDDDFDGGSEPHLDKVPTLSKEELLLRASLQPMATFELDGVNVTSI